MKTDSHQLFEFHSVEKIYWINRKYTGAVNLSLCILLMQKIYRETQISEIDALKSIQARLDRTS